MSEESLKERQIEVAQTYINLVAAGIRPQYIGKKVADVETTGMHNEVILHLDDHSKMKVTGLDAKHILAGKLPFVGETKTSTDNSFNCQCSGCQAKRNV